MSTVREVEFADIEPVAALLRAAGMGEPTVEKWHHLWDQNPALTRSGKTVSRGWVLEEQGQIIGFACNFAQELHLGQRVLLSTSLGSLIVAAEYRGKSMQLILPFTRQAGVDLLLNTTCSPETAKIFPFLKFAFLPQAEYDLHLYWVLRPTGFLQAALRKKGYPAILSRLASTVLGPLLGLEGAVRGRRLRAGAGALETREVDVATLGPEFDDLFRRKVAESEVLLASRDAETLRWHFAGRDRPNPPAIVGAYDKGRLVGYAAVTFQDNPRYNLRRAYLADLIAERNDPETVASLLAASGRLAKGRGASLLEAVGFPEPIRAVMRRFRPRTRRNPAWPYYYRSILPDLQGVLDSPTQWYASLYDGDGSI